MEVWKEVPGYEGLYQISNMGNLRNRTGRLLKFSYAVHADKCNRGYARKPLCKNGEVKTFYIHRLVAALFVENPMNYKEVNHKNEIKSDNRASNLEWVNRKLNNGYGSRPRKVGGNVKLYGENTVLQYDKNLNHCREYRSMREAARVTGFCRIQISKYCDTEKLYKGYLWRHKTYLED